MTELTDADLRAFRRIKRQCEESDLSPEQLAVVPEGMAEVVREAYERADRQGVDVSELAIARTDDVATVERRRERLLADAHAASGVPKAELSNMSLKSLQRLSDTSQDNPSPSPRSEAVESPSYADTDRADELKANIEALEGKSGPLAEKQREIFEEELEELRK